MTEENSSPATGDQRPLTVAVVGPGAIGTTIAAALYEGGASPMVCGRTPRDQLALRDGDDMVVVPGPVLVDPDAVDRTVDLAFLSVKATQTEGALGWLEALCAPSTVVCVLQNGVEQEKSLGHLSHGRAVPAVVWFPAQTLPDGAVQLRGDARLTLPDVPAADVVVRALAGSRCAVDVSADFVSEAWRKLLQNAAAGLMALTHRRSGMFHRTDIGRLTTDYLRECLSVARAEGAALDDADALAIVDTFRGFPPDMGTSILADREAGRPLEWDVRNGVVQRLGKLHSLPTPISDVLVPLLAAASDGPG
ncbi:oxidoreductase [Streptomyces hygroscopicus]|uniref:oxidoreductase n=1 Tax=Streptomyces hygroscopicus TaxID=1912 RepID=UPI0018FEB226|nr:oxidoreductase [Streptomyces hygroscopicus]